MVHPYLRRRNGVEPVDCPPGLQQVLEKTKGVPLFQEQAMQIAIVGAGFTPDDADKLRRSMASFRRNGDIEKFRDQFIAGMVKNGYARGFAERCFSQIEGFGTYGFPESHAASFSLLVYVSAWIKCFHPEIFACALLNSQPMGFYAPAQIVRDARDHGVPVLPVDVNHSDWDCTLEPLSHRHPGEGGGGEKYALRLGFRQIKGFSEADSKRLIAARGAGYDSAEALWRRCGLGRLALERLAAADALRSLDREHGGLDRRQGLWALKALGETPLPLFAAALQKHPASFETLPAVAPQDEDGLLMTSKNHPHPEVPSKAKPRRTHEFDPARTETRAAALLPPMPLGEHVVKDYASLSLSLKRHPLAFLRDELREEGIVTAAELMALPVERRVRVAGLVLIRQRPGSAKGVIFITLEDESGVANLIIWPPILERFRRVVLGATLLCCRGRLQREEGVIHVVADELRDFTPRLHTLRERGAPHELNGPPPRLPFGLPERVPGHRARDFYEPLINIHSRDFR